jgi:hypothetical protein
MQKIEKVMEINRSRNHLKSLFAQTVVVMVREEEEKNFAQVLKKVMEGK